MEVLITILVIALVAGVLLALLLRTSEDGARDAAEDSRLPRRAERTGGLAMVAAQDSGVRAFFLEGEAGREKMLGEVVPRSDAVLLPGEPADFKGARVPAALNQAVQTIPTVVAALSKGEVVRIVGPEHLVKGLKAGELSEVFSKGRMLGNVRGPDGRFAGPLHFESAQEASVPATVAGPLVLFQAASMVTMQYYLHQITTRLVSIQDAIEDVKSMLHASTVGEVAAARETCAELEALTSKGAALAESDINTLASAEQQAKKSYYELRDRVQTFEGKVSGAVSEGGELRPNVKAKQVKELLTITATEGSRDVALWLEALFVRIRLARLRALATAGAEPARLDAVRENLERQLDEMREDFSGAARPFSLLNIRRRELQAAWRFGAPEQELDEYRGMTRELRATLRTPIRRALPPLPPPQPFVLEMVQGRDGLESRYAVLEAGDGEA